MKSLLSLGIGMGIGIGYGWGAEAPPVRYHSPSGKYDIIFEKLPDDWSHYRKAIPGAATESKDEYAIALMPKGSSEPVNAIYYADAGPLLPPEQIVQSMQWSPSETFVVLPDKQRAREGNHFFQLVAPLDRHKVWSLEANHVQWIDDQRFVGDVNTKQLPGGVMQFDSTVGKAELLVAPDGEIGYKINGVSGRHVLIEQFLNDQQAGKSTWAAFSPDCLTLDLDTFKKSSVSCPKQ